MGLAERLDVAVFSSEVGQRKPHPLIFRTALDALEASSREQALFVGDSLYADIAGARGARDDDRAGGLVPGGHDERGPEPDFQAFTPDGRSEHRAAADRRA